MYPKLLTGSASPAISKQLATIALLVAVAVVLGTVYFGWRAVGSRIASDRVQPVTQPSAAQAASTAAVPSLADDRDSRIDDLQLHIDHIRRSLRDIGDNAKRAQTHIRRVAPSLDQYYLATQRQRLEAGDAAIDAVFRSLASALDELEVVNDSLRREQ